MPVQNLVSGTLTQEQKTAIEQAINAAKTALPFTITLDPKQKKELVKVGNTYLPFIDLAYEAVTAHPEVMSGAFNIPEFKTDYQLEKDLAPLLHELEELVGSVQATMFAAESDAMSEALEIYASVQQNKNKIPGLDVIAANMAAFFKKTRRPKSGNGTTPVQ